MNKRNILITLCPIIIVMLTILSGCGNDCKFEGVQTDSLPNAVAGEEYYYILEFKTSCSPVYKEVTVIDGNLPKGLELKLSGEFMGMPEEDGVFNFVINANVCFGSGGFGPTDCSDKEKEFTLIVDK